MPPYSKNRMSIYIQSSHILLIIYICLAFLLGCEQQTLHSQFDTYETRLTTLLKERAETLSLPFNPADQVESPKTYLPLIPAKVPPQQFISLSELQSLDFCGLEKLIAEHNSPLGKLALPSQKLTYELMLAESILACDTQTLSHQQNEQLTILKTQKLPELVQHWQVFLTQSKALTQHFTAGNSNVSFPIQRLQPQYFALAALVSKQDYIRSITPENGHTIAPKAKVATPSQHTDIEQHLKTLDTPFLGESFRAIHYSTARLKHINALLANNTHLITCQAKRNQNHLAILNNIFQHYYAKQIQPNLSVITQDLQTIQPLLAELYSFQPSQFKQHYFSHTQPQHIPSANILTLLNITFKNHAKWWVNIRQQCSTTNEASQNEQIKSN